MITQHEKHKLAIHDLTRDPDSFYHFTTEHINYNPISRQILPVPISPYPYRNHYLLYLINIKSIDSYTPTYNHINNRALVCNINTQSTQYQTYQWSKKGNKWEKIDRLRTFDSFPKSIQTEWINRRIDIVRLGINKASQNGVITDDVCTFLMENQHHMEGTSFTQCSCRENAKFTFKTPAEAYFFSLFYFPIQSLLVSIYILSGDYKKAKNITSKYREQFEQELLKTYKPILDACKYYAKWPRWEKTKTIKSIEKYKEITEFLYNEYFKFLLKSPIYTDPSFNLHEIISKAEKKNIISSKMKNEIENEIVTTHIQPLNTNENDNYIHSLSILSHLSYLDAETIYFSKNKRDFMKDQDKNKLDFLITDETEPNNLEKCYLDHKKLIQWLINHNFLKKELYKNSLYRNLEEQNLRNKRNNNSIGELISLSKATKQYNKDREWFLELAITGKLSVYIRHYEHKIDYIINNKISLPIDKNMFKNHAQLIYEPYKPEHGTMLAPSFTINDLLHNSIPGVEVAGYLKFDVNKKRTIPILPTSEEKEKGFIPKITNGKNWFGLTTKKNDGKEIWNDRSFYLVKNEINMLLNSIEKNANKPPRGRKKNEATAIGKDYIENLYQQLTSKLNRSPTNEEVWNHMKNKFQTTGIKGLSSITCWKDQKAGMEWEVKGDKTAWKKKQFQTKISEVKKKHD